MNAHYVTSEDLLACRDGHHAFARNLLAIEEGLFERKDAHRKGIALQASSNVRK